MHRAIYLSLCSMALLSTAIAMGALVALALHLDGDSSVQTLSQTSATLEATVLATLVWFPWSHASASFQRRSAKCLGVDYGASLVAILLATIATVATLIQFGKSMVGDGDEKLPGPDKDNFLIGLSVAIGIVFALQAGFLSLHIHHMRHLNQKTLSQYTLRGETHRFSASRAGSSIKFLCSGQNIPAADPTPQMMNSMDSPTPPSTCGRFRAGAFTPIKFQLSNAMRSMTPKTGLITNEPRGLLSSTSTSHRPSSDTFDTWDTSSVEVMNYQTVDETTSSLLHTKSHILGVIPGSSTASKTPSPHEEIPLEPSGIWARSRGYSPIRSGRKQLSPLPRHPRDRLRQRWAGHPAPPEPPITEPDVRRQQPDGAESTRPLREHG
ncbi:hypothetical protein CDV31_017336 [Fusarium ambrosium]|uniref:Uncharacterized protein n=1 Tax=Fusarium ambrosium TaxID=131363 RepID=A0A428RIC2_9HYPO|nr:hypothetical protein CDV31_017336 [Fusarium ambrosium]